MNTLIIDILYFTTLIIRTVKYKTISYDSIAGMINAAWTLNNAFNVIKDSVPLFTLHSNYIDNYKEFLNLKSSVQVPKQINPLPDEIKTIQIKNGRF